MPSRGRPDIVDLAALEDLGRPERYYRDDAVRWVWILYGLAQAVVTMLIAFGVLEGTTVAAVVTAVALIVYVGVNEILVRPRHSRIIAELRQTATSDPPDPPSGGEDAPADPLDAVR
jgi:hypothetical protein